MSVVEVQYHYNAASRLATDGKSRHLSLVADKAVPEPVFLQAHCLEPVITARSLRAVSEIVGSRFYVPPSMLARILREADPVVTVGDETLRFEGFSACCSAYIRLDTDAGALKSVKRSRGTTNVDFGPDLRAALAGVRADSDLMLSVGQDSVAIDHNGTGVEERKVPLPVRWVKGFGEVQAHLADMTRAFDLPKVAAHRFLRSLPRGKADHLQWISRRGTAAMSAAREAPGAVPLRGGHRLRVLETLAPLCRSLVVWHNAALGSTAWVLDFGKQRLSLVLNAEPWRGFSGDGGLLRMMASGDRPLAAVQARLHWQDRIEPDAISAATGMSGVQVRHSLALLAGQGKVGFDLETGAWFHRVLPFGDDMLPRLAPRLRAAQALVGRGAVTVPQGGGPIRVTSGTTVHQVRLSGETPGCTCPWIAKNGLVRGPCKHMLAAEIALEALK